MNLLPLLTSDGSQGGQGLISIVIMYVALFGILYFLMIRPQRKKQKETQNMQSAVEIGDSVLTVGGLYGTVVDEVNDVIIVELGLNKSVRVPVLRSSIASVAEPDLTINNDEDDDEE